MAYKSEGRKEQRMEEVQEPTSYKHKTYCYHYCYYYQCQIIWGIKPSVTGSHREMECLHLAHSLNSLVRDEVFSPCPLTHLYNEDKGGQLNKRKCMVYVRKNFISKIPVTIVMFCILSVRSGSSLTLKSNLSNILCVRVYTRGQNCYVDIIRGFYINSCPSPSHKV